MSSEKMREEFEVAYRQYLVDTGTDMPDDRFDLMHSDRSQYFDADLQLAWWAWQRSRSALIAHLPEPEMHISAEESLDMDPEDFEYFESRHGAQYQTYRKCRKAIEAIGIKVKP